MATNMTPAEVRAWESMAKDGTLGRYVGLRGCEPRQGRRGRDYDTEDYLRALSRRAQEVGR